MLGDGTVRVRVCERRRIGSYGGFDRNGEREVKCS